MTVLLVILWDRNYSADAIEAMNANNQVAFQIKLVENAVRFQGVFFDSDGNSVGVVENPSGGYALVVRKKGSTLPYPKIEPLFKYPSAQHLGEFAAPPLAKTF